MNFENIKQKMNSESMDGSKIPVSMKDIETSKMPIQKVRKSMKSEIITQLVLIVIFFAVPSFLEMHRLPKTVYYIFMFITSLITLGYLAKMSWFLTKYISLNNNSKETVVAFIYDLKLTLEVYKTAIISGSLLLPLAMASIFLGSVKIDEKVYNDLILLNMANTTLLLYIFGYIVIAILIYLMTVSWSNKLYGVHIKNLEKILKEFDVE
ncbi:hypothetical protein HSX10_17360 [Winogradskyella undariae]|uniref:hypothetical protein n=1 Tax=Winogradskyella undariae TaxID=1285465 RepID=UPI00156B2B8E|nr:hypothetical protein [Winogradskyella undariae]NRR93345.1 hypothetical protein [Winogradskyella undariae]